MTKLENCCQECGNPLRWFNNTLHEKCWKVVLERVFSHGGSVDDNTLLSMGVRNL